jgi:hypothetical protein
MSNEQLGLGHDAPGDFWGPFQPSPSSFRSGRSVPDGYARGWGLQFNNLGARIVADPLYREALSLAKGRSVMNEANRWNLYLIIRYFLADLRAGHIVEFGSFRGGNALFMARLVQLLYPGMRVYALDTFEGMPPTDQAVDAHGEGDFSDVNLDELQTLAIDSGLDNLTFVKGRFEDTAPALLENQVERVCLAHIDCDIFSAVSFSYEVVRPYMVPKGYLVFDDATVASCIGATEAVETLVIRRDGLNCEQIYPQFVFRAP